MNDTLPVGNLWLQMENLFIVSWPDRKSVRHLRLLLPFLLIPVSLFALNHSASINSKVNCNEINVITADLIHGKHTSLPGETEIRNYSIQNEWLSRFLIIGKTENYEPVAE